MYQVVNVTLVFNFLTDCFIIIYKHACPLYDITDDSNCEFYKCQCNIKDNMVIYL